MIQTIQLQPGVTLRHCTDRRFKTNCLSFQLVRPLCREEASANALISAVLLRGTAQHPDLRSITLHLDDLYGATVGSLVRKVGDYQTTGIYCGFTEDRFALNQDAILEPMVEFLQELLLQPLLDNGGFCPAYVESEQKNMLSAMQAQKNDKRVYASQQLLKHMGKADCVGISRMGEPEQVEALEPVGLYEHYQKILRESRIELFYVGTQSPERISRLLTPLLAKIPRQYVPLPAQTPFCDAGQVRIQEQMDVTQARLHMGFLTPTTLNTPFFVPMQMFNSIFGAGMTSKLFMQIREKQSLCYEIGSSYLGGKGILTVGAGMDVGKIQTVEDEVLRQLESCRQGQITPSEMESARQALLSGLRVIHDSPGSIENFYSTGSLSGMELSLQEYMHQVDAITPEQVAQAAQLVKLHSVFVLKGVQ